MKKIAILYHRADLDGVLSGVIADHFLAKDPNNNITAIGCDYGDNLKKLTLEQYEKIYVLDFSDEWLLSHPAHSKKVVWIDHHKSAIDKGYKVMQYCVNGVAACRLTYQFFTNKNWSFLESDMAYFNRVVTEPFIVTLAGEYDIWDLTSPLAKFFNKSITNLSFEHVKFVFESLKNIDRKENGLKYKEYDRKFIFYKEYDRKFIFSHNSEDFKTLQYLINKGEGVIEYIRSTEQSCQSVPVELFGLKGFAYNTHIRTSDIAKQKGDFTMVWNYQGGDKIKVSLYSQTKDVSVIAVKMGGGGHSGVCGFQCYPHILSQILLGSYP